MKTQDLENAVRVTLGDFVADYDLDGIVDALRDGYGPLSSLDDVPTDEYWDIVKRHDTRDEDDAAE